MNPEVTTLATPYYTTAPEMEVLPIEMLGSEVLRKRAREVEAVDEETRLFIQRMFQTMYAARGVGLAAPQVGEGRRIIVVDVREEGRSPLALINPRVVERSREKESQEEGCLSIPGVSAAVERALRVAVEGMNEEGEAVRVEGEGLMARCLLHEIDHLDGILYIDHLQPLGRSMLLRKWRKLQKQQSEGNSPRPGALKATAR